MLTKGMNMPDWYAVEVLDPLDTLLNVGVVVRYREQADNRHVAWNLAVRAMASRPPAIEVRLLVNGRVYARYERDAMSEWRCVDGRHVRTVFAESPAMGGHVIVKCPECEQHVIVGPQVVSGATVHQVAVGECSIVHVTCWRPWMEPV